MVKALKLDIANGETGDSERLEVCVVSEVVQCITSGHRPI